MTLIDRIVRAPRPPSRRLWARPVWQRAAILAAPPAALAAGLALWPDGPPAAAAPPPPTVTTANPLQRTVTQWDDYVGRFEASRTVDVRPRVSGQIVATHFTDGAVVRKGQLLFTIDPRPFEAALAEARAGVATARSELALARTNLARAQRLLTEDAVSQSSVDQLTALVQTASAALAAAQARVRQRSLDLEFTQIRAPIGGRISDAQIDTGNLVTGGDRSGTLLTTINALDPIHFAFDVPESLLLKANRLRGSGGTGAIAEVRLQDELDYRWRGTLDFVDNSLSRSSGTIRARAVLRNPGNFLVPGMFGNMRLVESSPQLAMLVPDSAIRTDQARKILLVVGQDGMVAARPVVTGPLVSGLRVVRSGLRPEDRLVIKGLQLAVPGTKVRPRPGRILVAGPAAPGSESYSTPSASQATLADRHD